MQHRFNATQGERSRNRNITKESAVIVWRRNDHEAKTGVYVN